MSGGLVAQIGQALDAAGLRGLVAAAASGVYGLRSGGRRSFSVDAAGRWVNRQPEATIVSPTIHTAGFGAFQAWVLDNWAWQYRPKAGDTVIDVGAGVGEEAVIFSKMTAPGGRVISIEAHPDTFACLQQTVAQSRLEGVTPLLCAVTEQDGTALIAERENHLSNSIVTGRGGQELPARSLDSLADELGLGEVALLKMNIEGAERMAVRGMTELARRTRHVAISCHDFISDDGGGEEFRTFHEVRSALEAQGFEITTRHDHPNPWTRYYLYGRNHRLG